MDYMSTSGDGTGDTATSTLDKGTAYAAIACIACIACAYADYDHAERMHWLARLGAVVGTSVKYWPVFCAGLSGPQRPRPRPRRMGIWAGFMSRSRGLHWDRKRR